MENLIACITGVLDLDPRGIQGSEVAALVERVYRKQRSSFVHGAQLRHQEYSKSKLPTCVPGEKGAVGDLYWFVVDLSSMEALVRKVLLAWLSREAGVSPPYELFGLNVNRIIHHQPMEGVWTVTSRGSVMHF